MTKDIVLFKNGELELEVTVSENREDVWLSQDQMATLLMQIDKESLVTFETFIMTKNLMKLQHVRKTHKFNLKENEKSNVILESITSI